MTFREVKRMEHNRRKWEQKSRKLFKKYSQLDKFNYEYQLDYDGGWFGEDYIVVGENEDEPKRYWVSDSKEGYKGLKYMLDLELQIRYKNEK